MGLSCWRNHLKAEREAEKLMKSVGKEERLAIIDRLNERGVDLQADLPALT